MFSHDCCYYSKNKRYNIFETIIEEAKMTLEKERNKDSSFYIERI
jgi:hypothetical protein